VAIELIAELATAHGGNLDLALEMCSYAIDGGATMVKGQAYRKESINPQDPQADWLNTAWLSSVSHLTLKEACAARGIKYFASVFDALSIDDMRHIGMETFKIASTESANDWWRGKTVTVRERWFVSYPWGRVPHTERRDDLTRLAAIPLYPTPLEAVGFGACGEMGWSDHCVGLAGCEYAIAHGSDVIEVHVSIPGKGRNCVFDKTQSDLKRIREWMEDVETIRSGVSATFRNRWVR
jgi:sialic acid synthase SpsE